MFAITYFRVPVKTAHLDKILGKKPKDYIMRYIVDSTEKRTIECYEQFTGQLWRHRPDNIDIFRLQIAPKTAKTESQHPQPDPRSQW